MKILLTGRGGQLGNILNTVLPVFGNITAVDREEINFSDLESLHALLDSLRPNLIVNAAAFTDVDGAELEPKTANTVNGAAPGLMARWANANDAAIFHYSTDYVFDGSGDTPWREDDKPNPINTYGESKRIGDAEVLASGAPNLIMRTSWVYAAQGQNFMQTMLRLGTERQALRVVDDQIGAPTPARMLAETTAHIIGQADGNIGSMLAAQGGIVNVTPEGETSWHGFAEAIFQSAKRRGIALQVEQLDPIPSTDYPLPAARPLNSRLERGALRDRFQLRLPNWRDALESVLDEIMPHRSV